MTSFNVIWQDFNTQKFESYDIMPYLISTYNNLKEKDRPTTFDEYKSFIKKESMYMWWSRCEYEIILCGWPNSDTKEKWDIYQQIMMNIDIITRLLIENIQNKNE